MFLSRSFVLVLFLVGIWGSIPPPLGAQEAYRATDGRGHPDQLAAHFDQLVPSLLQKTGVAGAAVGLIRNGRVAFIKTFGEARTATSTPVGRHTLFNVGSIAKPLTAWGVLKLIEAGKVDLDTPVWKYVGRWRLPDGPYDAEGITVRRLLSHTAGLSMSAVPDLPIEKSLPNALTTLRRPDHLLTMENEAGAGWSYSGGGYIVLQLLVEEVSGMPFATFMEKEVLQPLGMVNSRFGRPPEATRAGLAQPYDSGHPAPDLQWAGVSAAGLYTTVEDLALFVAASLGADSSEADNGETSHVLDGSLVRLMATPAPDTNRPYTTRYGLGHDLWPLPDGRFAAGHNGQNMGWAATAWWVPGTGDGIVVLTNDSDGMSVHKWVMCDWIEWVVEPAFGGYCRGREIEPSGTLKRGPIDRRGTPAKSEAGAWWEGRVADGEPGGVLSIRRWGRELLTAARGLRDLSTGDQLEPNTPFYIASVAKPLTARLVERLTTRGLIDPYRSVGEDFPEIPILKNVSVRQLLDQTAGVPDYHGWIDLTRLVSLNDRNVVDSLANHPDLLHTPGERFAYSNTHYILLAELMRRRTGQSLRQIADAEIVAPLGLASLWIDDGDQPAPVGTAEGYRPEGLGFRLSSYERIDLPGSAPLVTMRFATTGAGGVFMNAVDLARWGEENIASLGRKQTRAPVPVDGADLGALIGTLWGYREGWFVSDLRGHTVYWHDGNRGGYGSVLAIVPAEGITVAFLANRSDLVPEEIVEEALRALLDSP